MTSKNLMPFGKHKGIPMGDVPKSYLQWLIQQDGFADKNKEMARWIKEGDATAPAVETKNNEAESELLRRAPESFKHWWAIAYGDRCRKEAPHHYIPFMRVALEAWLHATGIQLAAQEAKATRAVAAANTGSITQPTEVDILKAVLPPSKPAKQEDYMTENVPF